MYPNIVVKFVTIVITYVKALDVSFQYSVTFTLCGYIKVFCIPYDYFVRIIV